MTARLIPYAFQRRGEDEMRMRGNALFGLMQARRSCRDFSPDPVPRDIIERAIAVAHTAPSGANRKPWRFVVVDDPAIRRDIRRAAEEEERENYRRRFPPEWLEALEPIGTDAHKPFLEVAPYLVVMFRIDWEEVRGERVKNYYPAESAGIAAGMFLMTCHQMGLATLTHTPSPMSFLRNLLARPANEKPFLLIPVGYPAEGCTVPDIPKKPLHAALQWNRGPDADGSARDTCNA
jgi:nitroreductase